MRSSDWSRPGGAWCGCDVGVAYRGHAAERCVLACYDALSIGTRFCAPSMAVRCASCFRAAACTTSPLRVAVTSRSLELGGQSASHFEQHAKMLHGGMTPGLVFELSRRGAKSPVHSEVSRVQESVDAVPRLLLAQRVMALYKFPCCNPGDTIEQYESRLRSIAQRRNEYTAKQLTGEMQQRV